MKGRLIVLEAGDGCGKATQTRELTARLEREGRVVRQLSFPDYDSDSSALIKMYLSGQLGDNVADVNAYAASTFYAVDRYASYCRKWRQWYNDGDIIIADRYTTSNMVHQSVKLEDSNEREAFLRWLWDLEFNKMALPAPDLVIFLDVPPQFSLTLIDGRAAGGVRRRDLHERDAAYLARCYRAYNDLSRKYGWRTIDCIAEGKLKSIAQIHEEIYALVINCLRSEDY